MNLAGGVNEAMYKSRSYAKMRIWPRFSAQAFRNQADNRPNRRDLYMESSFCRCFLVQARLVHEPRRANQPVHKQNAPHCCEAFGAENETRTRDPDLGKVVLYQLSYFRRMSKTRSRGTGLQRYGKNPNLQIFFQFFRFLDFAALRSK